ncbi:MAG: hypothetical protein WBG42_01420 [Cryomorphaceae bacterium]
MRARYSIEIKSNSTLNDILALYTLLDRYRELECDVDLVLPKEIQNKEFGIIPLLFQFAATWTRYGYSKALVLKLSNNNTLKEYYENDITFTLVSFVWTSKEILDEEGNSIKSILKEFNKKYHNQMRALDKGKDWKIMLSNFDHLPSNRGVLNFFENEGKFIQDKNQLENNLREVMDSILNFSKEARAQYARVSSYLMSIIYELMKNTFEWAKSDEKGVPLNPNCRSVYVRFYKRQRAKLIEENTYHSGLQNYFRSDSLKENTKGELFFLEIDVFDTGVGFVKKFSANKKDEKNLTDVDIIKTCFLKHRTSAKGMYSSEKGIGLDQILTLLNQKGYLQIKTDKYFLYRNLITQPKELANTTDYIDVKLFDVQSHSEKKIKPSSYAIGTSITVIYPLNFTEND